MERSMKKLIPFLAAALLLAGCGNNSNQMSTSEPSGNVTPPGNAAPGSGAPAGMGTNAATTNTNAMGNGASTNSSP